MYIIKGDKMSGKTHLFAHSSKASVFDKCLLNAIFGPSNDNSVNLSLSKFGAANGNYFIPLTVYAPVEGVSAGQQDFERVADCSIDNIVEILITRYKAIELKQEEAVSLISSGTYFSKQRGSYSNTKVSKVGARVVLDSRWFVLHYNIDDEDNSLLLALQGVNYGRESLTRITFAALNVETFKTGYTTELFPMVITEGFIQIATQYTNLKIAQYKLDKTSSFDAFYKLMTNAVVKLSVENVKNGGRFLETMSNEEVGVLLETDQTTKVFAKHVSAWRSWLRKGSELDFDPFSVSVSMTECSGLSSSGFGPITVTQSPLAFQLDCRGTLFIDSLLSFIYTPSRSSLPGSLNADAATAFSASTYKPVFVSYGQLGEKDPLRGYDLGPLMSGDVLVDKGDAMRFDPPIYAMTRLDGRSHFYRMPFDNQSGFIFKSDHVAYAQVAKDSSVIRIHDQIGEVKSDRYFGTMAVASDPHFKEE